MIISYIIKFYRLSKEFIFICIIGNAMLAFAPVLFANYDDFELAGFSSETYRSLHHDLKGEDVKECLVSSKKECLPWVYGSPIYGIKALAQLYPELEEDFKLIMPSEHSLSERQYMSAFARYIQDRVLASRRITSPFVLSLISLPTPETYDPKKPWHTFDPSLTTRFSDLPKGTLSRKLGEKMGSFNKVRKQQFKDPQKKSSANLFEDDFSQEIKNLVQLLKEKGHTEFCTTELAQALLSTLDIAILTDVKVETMQGGFVSGKIYKITGRSDKENKTYFLKYLRKSLFVGPERRYGEVWNLKKIKELLEMKKLKDVKELYLVLPEFEGQYDSTSHKKKIFTISSSAKGKCLTDIVASDLESDPNHVSYIFKTFGHALGKFQSMNVVFPTTPPESIADYYNNAGVPVHGDMHSSNMFWDDESELASFIDTETLAYSFDEEGKPIAPLVYDIFYFIQQANRRFSSDELEKMQQLKWNMYTEFVEGYISGFPTEVQKGLRIYLEGCFRHADDVKFTDLFRRVWGCTVTWEKAPDDKWSKLIITAVQKHLELQCE